MRSNVCERETTLKMRVTHAECMKLGSSAQTLINSNNYDYVSSFSRQQNLFSFILSNKRFKN